MNKKLLVLLGVYASGVAAALLYNKKSPSQIKEELDKAHETGEKSFKVLFNNFIEIHQNLLGDFKAKVLTEENRDLLYSKRDELLELVSDFRVKGEDLLVEYRQKGKEYANEGVEKLEKFYNETLKDLEDLKKQTPEKIEDIKSKLRDYFTELKSKFKK